MEFFTLLIVFGLGFGAGKLHAYYKFVRLIKDLADEAGIDIISEIKKVNDDEDEPVAGSQVGKLVVEAHGDVLYLFEKDTDNFICQGKTLPELAKGANEYKHIAYAVVKYGDQVFTFQNGESTEVTA